jgi:hypothetical protein
MYYINIKKMKINLFAVAAVFIASLGCMVYKTRQQPKYSKVELSYVMPYMVNPTFVDTMPVMRRVLYAGDYQLYEISSRQVGFDSVLLYDSLLFTYYVHKKNEQYGYTFTSLADTATGKRIDVDSVITSAGLKPFPLKPGYNMGSFTRSIKKEPGKAVYVYYVGGDSSRIDSAYYYLDTAYRNIKYSLTPSFDSFFNSKMYKLELLAIPYAGENAAYINRFRKLTFEMKPLPVNNQKELDAFFERYKKIEAAAK